MTDTKGYNDRLITAFEDVPYPGAPRDVRGVCDGCDEFEGPFIIDYPRLRAALDADRGGPVLRTDIDDVARRPRSRTRT